MIGDSEGQFLILFQPAGSKEGFFEGMPKVGKEIRGNQETLLKQLRAEHGMEVLGPPLTLWRRLLLLQALPSIDGSSALAALVMDDSSAQSQGNCAA